jgi:hypothetical protein
MHGPTNTIDALFRGGPFPHFQKSLGLFRPVGFDVTSRAVVSVLIGWFPLVVLVITDGLSNNSSPVSFLLDFGVHARSLLAAPLLILCELICLGRLESIALHFVNARLIDEADRPYFKALVKSTKVLVNSTLAEVVAIALSYSIALLLIHQLPLLAAPDWYFFSGQKETLSWTGYWYVFVSMPLLLILFFGWMWRVILWSRFLVHVSRMRLRLVAAHPDGASGLKFLNLELFAFFPLAFTFGVITAGSVANRVAYDGATLEGVEKTIGGLLIFVVMLFVGPLMIFVFNLHRGKANGILCYGRLAVEVGRQFELKWITHYQRFGSSALEAPDFSATTDLYQIVSNVHAMSIVPFELKSLIILCVAALLPFIPVILMTIPLKVILKELASLLF